MGDASAAGLTQEVESNAMSIAALCRHHRGGPAAPVRRGEIV
eukprot:gene28201-42812_t